ncbi:hypothetical protein TNCV_1787341 [Trichonephila clavipes]|nr:hypothetical protein TNCV_1787341 [Trichonephila clavipes]
MAYFSEPNGCRGWWSSKTGLEQKLIILSTLLFIVCFALVITVAVLKNKSKSGDPCPTTVAPTTTPTVITESTAVTEDSSPTSSVDPSASTTEGTVSSPVTPASTGSLTAATKQDPPPKEGKTEMPEVEIPKKEKPETPEPEEKPETPEPEEKPKKDKLAQQEKCTTDSQ